jgi:predicted nucleotidyltransferase
VRGVSRGAGRIARGCHETWASLAAVPPDPLPAPVAALARELASLDGVVGVVLGGSRAGGTHRPDSDWDLGLYYRSSQRPFDPAGARRLGHQGHVSELGEWGPVVNGGGWLTVAGLPVDVLFRDLDTIEVWLREAEQGRFEVCAQNGYVVGAPTYLPVGELALCEPISGELPRPTFPPALASAARSHWQGRASVSLLFAQGYARLADAVCCAGMVTDAILCTAHARLAWRREWGPQREAARATCRARRAPIRARPARQHDRGTHGDRRDRHRRARRRSADDPLTAARRLRRPGSRTSARLKRHRRPRDGGWPRHGRVTAA